MSKGLQAFYLFFCLLIAFAVWMLAYGAGLQLFYGDGRILEATITSNPFAPIQQFWAYSSSPSLQKVALGSVVPALLVSGLIAYLGLKPTSNPLGMRPFRILQHFGAGSGLARKVTYSAASGATSSARMTIATTSSLARRDPVRARATSSPTLSCTKAL